MDVMMRIKVNENFKFIKNYEFYKIIYLMKLITPDFNSYIVLTVYFYIFV